VYCESNGDDNGRVSGAVDDSLSVVAGELISFFELLVFERLLTLHKNRSLLSMEHNNVFPQNEDVITSFLKVFSPISVS
jgi:hypothetical protein